MPPQKCILANAAGAGKGSARRCSGKIPGGARSGLCEQPHLASTPAFTAKLSPRHIPAELPWLGAALG